MYLGETTAYQDMSDSELDATYAAAYQGYKYASGMDRVTWSQAMSNASVEILDRLANLRGFIVGMFGGTRFPQYDAIQKADPSLKGFQQSSEAQTAVKTQAKAVADTATSALKLGGVVVLSIGVAALALYIIVNRRK